MQKRDKVVITCNIDNPDIKILENQIGEIRDINQWVTKDGKNTNLITITFDDPDVEDADKNWGKTMFYPEQLKPIFLIHYSKYLDEKKSNFKIYDNLNMQNLSSAFKELECDENIVTQLIANEITLKKIIKDFSDFIVNEHLWTAKLIKNNLLSNNEIFISSN